MLVRQERVALILLVAVALTVIGAHAALLAIGKAPFARPFTSSAPDGELVTVEGTVRQAILIENGGHISLQVNNTTVFIPAESAGSLSVHTGDHVFLYGTVQTYRGKKEVIVGSPGDVRLLPGP